jgi:hypothetical protein
MRFILRDRRHRRKRCPWRVLSEDRQIRSSSLQRLCRQGNFGELSTRGNRMNWAVRERRRKSRCTILSSLPWETTHVPLAVACGLCRFRRHRFVVRADDLVRGRERQGGESGFRDELVASRGGPPRLLRRRSRRDHRSMSAADRRIYFSAFSFGKRFDVNTSVPPSVLRT